MFIKNLKQVELDTKNCKCCLEYSNVKYDLILYKCLCSKYILTDISMINMLLMGQKGIRGGICHFISQYAKANKKCIKDFDKNKKSSYLKYCYLLSFKWLENASQFREDFRKNYN